MDKNVYLCIRVCTDTEDIFNPWGVGAVPPKPVGFLFNEMKEIKLTQGQVALVDDDDYGWLVQWKWQALRSSTKYYATRMDRTNGLTCIYMHRAIMSAPLGMEVDHINGDGLDNRRSNLRLCTGLENHFNLRKIKPATSKYKGVCVSPEGYITAYAYENDRTVYIGRFKTEEDAALAYNEATLKIHGEFARLNEISPNL